MSVCKAHDLAAAPVIQLSHVSFAFEDTTQKNNSVYLRPYALHDVNLNINEGDFVGIIGPSGAGKTTLTSVLSGAIPHHFKGEFRGACLVAGSDTCEVELTDVSQIVGSVLQDIDAQMVSANVEDELLYGLENFGVDHEQIMPRICAALEAVGISDLLHRDIATLSGGQKQKVAIAAILALQPRVLVLDEPTAALDPLSSRQVFDTLRLLNQTQGITVVVVEQKVALLAEYCQRMLVLSDGTIALDGTPAEVLTHRHELNSIGVDSPRVTRISNKLHAKHLLDESYSFLTTDDAFSGIKNLIADNKAPRMADFEPKRSEDAYVVQCEPDIKTRQQAVLSFDHVGFSYGPCAASIKDIDFEVYPGELLAIIGQNGAGKTTLTKLMNGLLKPSEGRVNICGLDTSVARTSQIARHVSTLFQDPDHQICKETVLDEVAFSLELLGVDTHIARSRAAQTIKQFSLPADVAPFSLVLLCAAQNAAVGAVDIIHGSDFPIMTVNQLKLALSIAAASGRSLSPSFLMDTALVLACGLSWRQLARFLSKILPIGNWLGRGALGFAGTMLTARLLEAQNDGSLARAAGRFKDKLLTQRVAVKEAQQSRTLIKRIAPALSSDDVVAHTPGTTDYISYS